MKSKMNLIEKLKEREEDLRRYLEIGSDVAKIPLYIFIAFSILYYIVFDLFIDYIVKTESILILLFMIITYLVIGYLTFSYIDKKIEIQREKDEEDIIPRTKEELERTAYHEAGHAIIARISCKSLYNQKISIDSMNDVLGYNELKKAKNEFFKSDMLAEIQMYLGGLLAEDIIYGYHSNGCCIDMENALEIADDMVYLFAMGERFIYIGEERERVAIKIIEEEREKAKEILKNNIEILKKLQKLLLEKRTLNKQEIEEFYQENGI